MIGEEITCARPGCEVVVKKTTHNMKFCSANCCRIETNRKIMENYHEKVAIKNGKKRLCRECGITNLSRYNQSTMCSSCEHKQKELHRDQTNDLVASISWL